MTENTHAVASFHWDLQTTFSFAIPVVLKLLAKHLGPPSHKIRILDLGCGTGEMCDALHRAGYQVEGMEPDAQGCEIMRQRYPGIVCKQASLYEDPNTIFGTQKYDCVVSTEVIEHLYSPQRLPQFSAQVLAPGGLLIISTPYHGYLKNLLLSLLNYWDTHHAALWEGGHLKFFSRKTLCELLKSNGFTPLGFKGIRRLPLLWSSMAIVAQKSEVPRKL